MADRLYTTAPSKNPKEEKQFMDWWRSVRAQQGMDPNTSPYDKEHYYDNRGYYNDMMAGKAPPPSEGGHFPSGYKVAGHPRTFLNDPLTGKVFNTPTATYVAGGSVPQANMDASEQSPDMPGFDPDKVMNALRVATLMRGR